MMKTLGSVFACLMGLTLVGCAPPEPDIPVEDPRTFLIEELKKVEINVWWEPYRNNDPELLARVVDDTIERESKTARGMPSDKRRLEKLVWAKLQGRYIIAMDDSEEGRAYIKARAEERYADPPVTLEGNTAKIDYFYLPGEWGMVSKTIDAMKDCPAINGLQLSQDALVHSVKKAKEKFPQAAVFKIEYRFFAGASSHSGFVTYTNNGSISRFSNTYHTETKVEVPWDKLVSGEIDIEELDWEGPSSL